MILSASMIVKNEADRLATCLGSVREHVDEIVIVDTGSTDDTLDVARTFTDRVFRSDKFTVNTPPEEFHFSEARNEALDRCRGRYALSIDADEVLVVDSLRGPRETILASTFGHVYCLYLLAGDIAWPAPRILPLDGRTKWIGRIHEMPDTSRPFVLIGSSTGYIRHDRPTMRKANAARNELLLQRELRELWVEGGSKRRIVRILFELGRHYSATDRLAEAVGCHILASELCDQERKRDDTTWTEVHVALAHVLLSLGIHDLAYQNACRGWEVEMLRTRAAGAIMLGACMALDKHDEARRVLTDIDMLIENADPIIPRATALDKWIEERRRRIENDATTETKHEELTADVQAG